MNTGLKYHNPRATCARFIIMATLTLLLSAQRIGAEASMCTATLTVSGTYKLTNHLRIDCVVIEDGGILDTFGYDLTITGSGGLTCESGGKLLVNDGDFVELNGGGTSTVDGTVELAGEGSKLKIIDSDTTISGLGSIKGMDSAAKIDVAEGVTLRSDITISGTLLITGNGSLDNRGKVIANDNGTLELDSSLSLSDASGAVRWSVGENCSAVLKFSRSHTGNLQLQSDFEVIGGKLFFATNVDIVTSGSLSYDDGTIETAGGASFDYAGPSSGTCETQPSDPVPASTIFIGCACS